MPGPYDRLVVVPGQPISLGPTQGGRLLLGPVPPGAMELTDLQNRTWHLLREEGPDTGYPAPITGDFNVSVVTRDLNIALATFLSDTGLAPALMDRQRTFPVYPVLDYPLPPDLISIFRIEYNPYGSLTYKLEPRNFEDFDSQLGEVLPNYTGQPYIYREPFAGYIRLQPQPGPAEYSGPGAGTIIFGGAPAAGITITVQLVYGSTMVNVAPYICTATDNLESVAFNVAALINQSAAVTGPAAFLAVASNDDNEIALTAATAPGTDITYSVTVQNGTSLSAIPSSATVFEATGDTMTFYYTSLGRTLALPHDSPGLPVQFHMAIVYRVLMDYWMVKSDKTQSDHYAQMYKAAVDRAKAYEWDLKRDGQPTTAGDDDTGNYAGFLGLG